MAKQNDGLNKNDAPERPSERWDSPQNDASCSGPAAALQQPYGSLQQAFCSLKQPYSSPTAAYSSADPPPASCRCLCSGGREGKHAPSRDSELDTIKTLGVVSEADSNGC